MVVGALVVVGGTVWLLAAVGLAGLRDVAIVILAIESFIVTLLLGVIVVMMGRLLSAIHDEVTPIMRSAKRTVDTVQGTTTFVSDAFVSPLITVAGLASGVRGAVLALMKRRFAQEGKKHER